LDTPLLFLIFNRPETTATVFDKIKQQKPSKLYIAADGARNNNSKDIENCRLTRKLVIEGIDWDCDVKTLFRDNNAGCGKAVSEAINWFFSNEEYGIILEDDTVPDSSFFTFCTEMLIKYRHDDKVMHISGCYFLKDIAPKAIRSYYFTKHIHVWGWATWKRAWTNYDYDMQEWPTPKKSLKQYFGNYAGFWKSIFESAYSKGIDTWDYQWMFAIFKNKGIAINPTTNLIMNIGFNSDATHTSDKDSIYTTVKVEPLLKINHPDIVKIDMAKDELYYKTYLNVNVESIKLKLKTFLCKILGYLKR
jgi:hypothetical protein